MDSLSFLYETFLPEARQYRGQTDVRLKDLQKLGDVINVEMSPEGGSARTQHPFNPSIWTGWQNKIGAALAMAATDTARTVQTGNPQGGTVHKTNWGGKVVNIPAPARPHYNDRLGSSMDRYDVLMVGDIEDGRGVLTRIAWSPAIGTYEERRARLEALIAGSQPPPLKRRPQGEVPTAPDFSSPPADPVPRIGQNVKPGKER